MPSNVRKMAGTITEGLVYTEEVLSASLLESDLAAIDPDNANNADLKVVIKFLQNKYKPQA